MEVWSHLQTRSKKGPGCATITNHSQPLKQRGRETGQKLTRTKQINAREAHRAALSSASEATTMPNKTKQNKTKHKNTEQDKTT